MDVRDSPVTSVHEHEVLTLERNALARWCRGDPNGFLEIADPDIRCFDPFRATRIDGLEALRTYYEVFKGKLCAIAWQIHAPNVDDFGDVAVLTYRLWSWGARGDLVSWNCTEVFRRGDAGWRTVHSHWSLQPPEENG